MRPIKKLNAQLKGHRCERKYKYETYQLAQSGANRMNIKNERTMKLTLETRNRPYKCEFCNKYHIGKWSVEKV